MDGLKKKATEIMVFIVIKKNCLPNINVKKCN